MIAAKDTKKFILNGVEYIIYNSLIEKIEIFNVMSDCKTNEIPVFKWNIPQENLDDLMHYIILEDDNKIKNCNIIKYMNIVGFMKYFCFNNDFIVKTIKKMLKGKSLEDFLKECAELAFNADVIDAYENYRQYYPLQFDIIINDCKNICDIVKQTNFSNEFKSNIIKDLIFFKINHNGQNCINIGKLMSEFPINYICNLLGYTCPQNSTIRYIDFKLIITIDDKVINYPYNVFNKCKCNCIEIIMDYFIEKKLNS